MTFALKGRIVTEVGRRPVHGATVVLSSTREPPAFSARRVVTNRAGRFHLRIRSDHAGDDPGTPPPPLLLQVLDDEGKELKAARPAQMGGSDLAIDISDAAMQTARLRPQPRTVTVVPAAVLDTIHAAITQASASQDVAATMAALDRIISVLPPVLTLSEFFDAAGGVLRGRSEDIRAFDALLDDLESWNHQAYSYSRRQLTKSEAEHVLSPAFLQARVDHAAAARTADEPVLSRKALLVAILAAMRASREDPQRMVRNLGILSEQFCGLDPLVSLFRAAQLALAGGEIEQRMFLARLGIYAGQPHVPAVPGGGEPLPGVPARPFPCAGGPPWPPDPGSSGDAPRPVDDCEPEMTAAGRRWLAGRRTYTITGISPQQACPGDTITIVGTGLLFDGHSGVVNFPGLERGSYVPSDPPVSWTDTEIRVVVPEGVCDGLLDLDIPGTEDRILVCDQEEDLFVSGGDPVEFVGGETQILDFSTSASDACLAPGARVWLYGHACNATRIRLLVIRHAAEIIDELTLLEHGRSGPASYAVPSDLRENTRLTLRLEVSGPCGDDTAEQTITVRRGVPIAEPDSYRPGRFVNFLGNQRRDDLLVAAPATLRQLLKAIEVAEQAGDRVGIQGGACSYMECVVPSATTNRMINTDELNRTSHDHARPTEPRPSPPAGTPAEIWAVVATALRELDDSDSVMSSDVLDAYRAVIEVSPLRDRLVHVEAGIRFDRLVCVLQREGIGLTMPTLGGGKRHAVAGAISTGTHGSTTRLPPIADFVRAIHLIGAGGQQWWLEPGSKPITDSRQMSSLKARGVLDPCLNVRYDDELFYAALVSFGTAGAFYSLILETIDDHRFRVRTTQPSWGEAQTAMRARVIEPATPSDWYFDITVDAAHHVRLSTLELVPLSEPLVSDPEHHERREEFRRLLAGLPARLIPVFVLGWPLILACRTAPLLFRPRRLLRELRETREMIAELLRFLRDLWGLSLPPYHDDEIARAFPNFINLLWRLRACVPVGRRVIDELQSMITEGQRRSGSWVKRAHLALTFSRDDCPVELPPPRPVTDESAFERLFRSSEFAVPVGDALRFANRILNIAEDLRRGPDAFVLAMNIRFTRGTAALLGMQQFDRTCHVELFTIQGLNGNADFDRRVDAVVEEFAAIPHWGQLHDPSTDFASRFRTRWGSGRTRLETWQRAIDVLAGRGETPNTFRSDFALRRRLLTDL